MVVLLTMLRFGNMLYFCNIVNILYNYTAFHENNIDNFMKVTDDCNMSTLPKYFLDTLAEYFVPVLRRFCELINLVVLGQK